MAHEANHMARKKRIQQAEDFSSFFDSLPNSIRHGLSVQDTQESMELLQELLTFSQTMFNRWQGTESMHGATKKAQTAIDKAEKEVTEFGERVLMCWEKAVLGGQNVRNRNKSVQNHNTVHNLNRASED